MKRNPLVLAFAAAGLSLFLLTWQTSRFTSLASRAKKLERTQEEWIEKNRKLESDISVLTNRARASSEALRLGLEKARPDQRLRVVVLPAEAGK